MLTELITPADPAADSPADSAALAPVFDALLGELTQLSRNHLLYFRVQVGRSVADALYNGDPAAYHHQASNKDSSLRRFAAHRRDQLADLGLTEATLRQCVRAWFVARDLPDGTLERLVLSHLNLLSQVDDAASRRLLAQATLDNGWTGQELRDAIRAVQDGQWPDADPAAPGLQPPAPEPTADARPPQPGRVVSRFERSAEELDALIHSWAQVPAEKRSKKQVARVRAAVEAWKAKIARLEAELG
jgi:hypothetical protein